MSDIFKHALGFRDARVDPYLETSHKKILARPSVGGILGGAADENAAPTATAGKKVLAHAFEKAHTIESKEYVGSRRKSNPDAMKETQQDTTAAATQIGKKVFASKNATSAIAPFASNNNNEAVAAAAPMQSAPRKLSQIHLDHFNGTSVVPVKGASSPKRTGPKRDVQRFVPDSPTTQKVVLAARHRHTHHCEGARGDQTTIKAYLSQEQPIAAPRAVPRGATLAAVAAADGRRAAGAASNRGESVAALLGGH